MKLPALLLLLVLSAATSLAQVKTPTPAPVMPLYEDSLQIVVVTAKDWGSANATARLFERKDKRSDWKANGPVFPVTLGRKGMAVGGIVGTPEFDKDPIKKEGDDRSPAGVFPLTGTFGRGSKPNAIEMDYIRLTQSTECVTDVRSSHYNRIVDRYKVGNFDWKASEKLEAYDRYDLGVVVGYNWYPVEKGRGSCVFLHLWRDSISPTDGGTAMARRNMERIVGWLSPAKTPFLVQLPEKVYNNSRRTWRFPKLK